MRTICVMASVLFLLTPMMANSREFDPVSKIELYQQLFNIDSKEECKKSIPCRMLKWHIVRDNNSCQMNPKDVEILDQQINQTFENKLKIRGSIKYLRIKKGRYQYYVYNTQGDGPVIRARIFIKNIEEYSESEIAIFKGKLNQAAKIWNTHNPYPYQMKFDFDLTTDKDEAAVKVKLLKKYTRGPYFSKWSYNWSVNTIAHEFGHVLGLDDEYRNGLGGGSTKNCQLASIMCSSYRGKPQGYHYYLIFRRALCFK